MKEQIKLQEGIGLEEGANIRRCSECGKPLAEVNPGPECYSCGLSEVAGIGKHGQVIEPFITFGVRSPVTLCTSRETRGFDRVYIDYHGWGKGL